MLIAVAVAVASAGVGASASTAGSFTSVPCYGYEATAGADRPIPGQVYSRIPLLGIFHIKGVSKKTQHKH